MTDYEAIVEMQRMKKAYCNTHTDAQLKKDSKTIDALNIGIKAVEQQSITRADERPQGELAKEVWELYEKHQSHLGTYVYEFGVELKELLDRYGR